MKPMYTVIDNHRVIMVHVDLNCSFDCKSASVPSSEAKVRPLVIGGGPKTMFLAGIVSQSSWGEPF